MARSFLPLSSIETMDMGIDSVDVRPAGINMINLA